MIITGLVEAIGGLCRLRTSKINNDQLYGIGEVMEPAV